MFFRDRLQNHSSCSIPFLMVTSEFFRDRLHHRACHSVRLLRSKSYRQRRATSAVPWRPSSPAPGLQLHPPAGRLSTTSTTRTGLHHPTPTVTPPLFFAVLREGRKGTDADLHLHLLQALHRIRRAFRRARGKRRS